MSRPGPGGEEEHQTPITTIPQPTAEELAERRKKRGEYINDGPEGTDGFGGGPEGGDGFGGGPEGGDEGGNGTGDAGEAP